MEVGGGGVYLMGILLQDDLIIFPDDVEFKAVPACTTGTNVICPARAGFLLGAAPLRLLQQLRNSAAAVLVSASCWPADTQFNLTALDCSSMDY